MIRGNKRILTFLLWISLSAAGWAGNGLNDLLGIQLWGSGSLWNDVAVDTATRLRLFDHKNQSQNQGSDNGYFRANLEKESNLKVMGVRVYSIEIYSSSQKVRRVIIGFVNRADLISELEAEADESKVSYGEFLAGFETRLAREREAAYAETLKQLTRVLGAPTAGTSSNAKQWSWQDNLVTLENADLALTLRIEPRSQTAGAASATTVSQRKTKNLRARSNGDVVVTGIPPISQGPRGFCVPASWEKCLRYFGVNLDVYQLGEKGGTDYYGTPFIPFAAKIAPLIEPQHFKVKILNRTTLGLPLVRTYVDQAIPLIWGLNAVQMRYWVARSSKRTTYLNDHADGLGDPRVYPASPGGHALLIVGYNASFKEIALSDSTELGSGQGEIWIRESDMLSMAMPDGLVAVVPDDSNLAGSSGAALPASAGATGAAAAPPVPSRKWY